VLLRVPDLVVPSLQLRLHNQTAGNPLGPKLTEFAILIAAREWTNNFEWNAHSNAATTAGLSAAVIAAVADGRRPERMAEDEEIVWDFSNELLHNKSVSDPTYARALAKFGEAGVVELAGLEGYYTYLSMVMNTARSPMPANAKPALALFPK
jgi:4-carboxymuconolactone decarboxylase